MLKHLLFVLLLAFLSSCGGGNYTVSIKESNTSKSELVVLENTQKQPVCSLVFPMEIQKTNPIVKKIELMFSRLDADADKPDWASFDGNIPAIYTDTNLYQLFYQIGNLRYRSWSNKLLRYGWIQLKWHALLQDADYKKLSGSVSPDLGWSRIPDIDALNGQYMLSDLEKRDMHNYFVQYLLKKILFVSLQEILSRPERYLNQNDLDSVFYQAVILPEISAFTSYLVTKYGKNKFLELAKADYSMKKWKEILSEEMNDTEEGYAKSIEALKFQGVYLNGDYINKLESILKLCNQNTKSTLFRK